MNKKIAKQRKNKIIVTGGAGFIGSHLVDYLIEKGNEVIIIDDLSSGNTKNINRLSTFFNISTINFGKLTQIFQKIKPDYVYHLAANTNVPLSIKDPRYDFKTLEGSLNLLELCRKYPPKLFFYVSSGFIFGNTKSRPINETEQFRPISPYSITKRTIENYLEFYHSVYNLQYVGLRPATVYGPRQVKGAMADYMDKLYNDNQAEIYGDGSKTRDYLYVSDMISGINASTELPPEKQNRIFNIGTSIETSLLELYNTIAALMEKNSDPIFKDDRPGELKYYSIDHSLLTKETGWKPQINLREGLKKTLEFRGYIGKK